MIIPIIVIDIKYLGNADKETIVLSAVDKCILRKNAKKRLLLGWIPKEELEWLRQVYFRKRR